MTKLLVEGIRGPAPVYYPGYFRGTVHSLKAVPLHSLKAVLPACHWGVVLCEDRS